MPSKIASYIWDGCLATLPPFGKIIAQGTPSELVNNTNARNFYFGDAFKIS